jgi:uncharacterized protein YdhG (YjbR/CyaY superfamily)
MPEDKEVSNPGFSAAEKAAMKQYAAEKRAQAKMQKAEDEKAANLQSVLDAISALPQPDKALAEGIHELVTSVAPELEPRTWYGFPAYAKDGKVVCFFQYASKFKTRYSTFGFSESANLDSGAMWPVAYAVIELNAKTKAEITAAVKQAAS